MTIIADIGIGVLSALVTLAALYIKVIPAMTKELIHDQREFKNNQQLQVESFFHEQGGRDLKRLLNEWTQFITDETKTKNVTPQQFKGYMRDFVIYGSTRSVKLLASMQQYNYGQTDDTGHQQDEDYSLKLVAYVALIVCSLKQDFTGVEITPQMLMQIKLNDFETESEEFGKIVDTINNEIE
ncbi:hypothetical protein PQ472_05130 [Lacticaseibacillus pabuli]|uniref:Uncharacterized protein n=1 Tax=Lacticaseibacillus pabuli TaxID=3025672 RepID=A0ABY7X0D9_9LACO|nr:hypothetical protein [Lacticaseibacillus sp. KACC 23028]WDF83620.1 hypothetical protein PQ472_05130 [Lacticaseibacillus sp. KACC 23028]